MFHSFPAGNGESALYFEVKDTGELVSVTPGEGVFSAPTCAPREFSYVLFKRRDNKEVRVKPRLLLEPIHYEWELNHQVLESNSAGDLAFSTGVRTALPPPNGTEVPGTSVKLGYTLGLPIFGGHVGSTILALRPRSQDLNYSVGLTIRASDAAGRTFSNGGTIEFAGEEAVLGQDWYDYLDACLQKVVDIVDQKKLQKQRLKPGEPNELIPAVIQFFEDQVRAGNTQITTAVQPLVDAHGLKALNQAIAKLAAKTKIYSMLALHSLQSGEPEDHYAPARTAADPSHGRWVKRSRTA
jgi:hypothetical protein